ncbi:macrophage-expressed gene 1 protein-like [Megalobrama amblycephala]|uniref:macrophage-expressed gene 1 protein-like n=1 Tax=Megalobrama amblycephala TaxID=75352 RepID=UPI0020144FA3|nr:macrophage-expressed gene 1 protein-like [Megalobrama amblycephala]
MESRALCLLMLCCFIDVCNLHPLIHPSNGLGVCRKNSSLTALEVLPGGGWDNLRNIDMGRVMNLSYSQCQTTEDGVYLIPDEVFVIPQKVSGVETHSEIIMSWLNQTSSTSSSINADGSFLSALNGKYSEENKRMKTHQVKDNSVTSRVQIRNRLYTVKAYPDFTLDSRFAQQAVEIADAIENNQTHLATYLSEKLILDYGTHVITSVDAGATLVQEDYLKKSFVSSSQSDMSSVSASAGLNFFHKLKFDISSKESQESSQTQGYQSNIAYSLIQSHGGALFYPGMTLQKWQLSTLNNLVAIDRSGLPLHYFLNPSTFPDLPALTVNKMASSVQQAALKYYRINKRPGCVIPDSPNFNFQANIDDASCEGPVTNLSFGGIYQQCTSLTDGDTICGETAQTNPATGGYSCPPFYYPTLLRSERVEKDYTRRECYTYYESCGFFGLSSCTQTECNDVYHVRRAQVNTYWCFSNGKIPEYSGYLFGGLFGPSLQNPLTKSNSCPPNYFALKFLSNGMMVCLSKDYEAGTRFSVPFGGFFSCQSGNPLSNGQSRCPPQFSQHLAAISDGCEVLYCVQSGAFTEGQLNPIRLPPFIRKPLVGMNATNTVTVMTEGDRSWVRDGENKKWRLAKPGEVNRMDIVSESDMSSSQMSGGEIAGVAVGVMVLIALVVAGTVFLMKKRRSSGLRVTGGYQEL